MTVKRKSEICSCPHYGWPHRRGGGQCIWSKHNDEDKCLSCGEVCFVCVGMNEPEERMRGDSGTYCLSDCCGAPVIRAGEEITSKSA